MADYLGDNLFETDEDRIDQSEGIDPAKTNNSKECIVCCFFNHGFQIS